MTHYDVFNGDADGICALQQLRVSDPKSSKLITGVKRNIQLLQNISGVSGDSVTVLDISLDKNRADLIRLLNDGLKVEYFDHHYTGEIPTHANLRTHIDTSSDICTSLIVDNYLSGAHRLWAIVGTFGDSFDDKANNLADLLSLTITQTGDLKNLGTAINYNAYGASEDDLHFKPDFLANAIRPFSNPFDFIKESDISATLQAGYEEDLNKAKHITVEVETAHTALYILPNQPWARRVSGVFANLLSKKYPKKAHALLTEQDGNSYLVSVRAPLTTKTGADKLCRQFATGGGRKAAAGINSLLNRDYEIFLNKFNLQFNGINKINN